LPTAGRRRRTKSQKDKKPKYRRLKGCPLLNKYRRGLKPYEDEIQVVKLSPHPSPPKPKYGRDHPRLRPSRIAKRGELAQSSSTLS